MRKNSQIALARFSIKDIESITGIKAHTLRIWEQRYGIIKPERTSTNIRYYSDQELRRILNITILLNNGYRISKIAKMSRKEMEDLVLASTEKIHESASAQSKGLISFMLELDELGFNRVLNTSILQHGLDATMMQIVFPFLNQIGVMWQTGAIHPAHEHFISNLIRQKLFVAIDGQTGKLHPARQRFLLFLPEGEPHEIGLLYANYILRYNGHEVVYLGQNVPLIDLQKVFELYQPDYVVSTVIAAIDKADYTDYISQLGNIWPEATIYISGFQVERYRDAPHPANVVPIATMTDFISTIQQLSGRN